MKKIAIKMLWFGGYAVSGQLIELHAGSRQIFEDYENNTKTKTKTKTKI